MKNAIKNTTPKKIVLLNQTTLDSMMGKDNITIIKNFTETGITILEADFGFAWWKFRDNEKYQLAYKSPTTPYEPTIPRENAGNYVARTTKKPFFDSEVKKKNYVFDISRYLKSYIIIPIFYNEFTYGSLVLCYKKNHFFTEDEIDLATVLGTTTAQTITINRLIVSEHEARRTSEKQEARFRALVENINEVIVHIDEKGKILYVSPSADKILGGNIKKMVGKNINKITYDNKEGKKINYLQKILQSREKSSVVEFSYKEKKDGSTVFLEATSNKMSGNLSGVVINIRDITERKNIAQKKETERLLEEERQKVKLLADANHELRTPIAIIKGNIDLALMQNGKGSDKPQSTVFRAINHEIDHLTDILSDLNLVTLKEEGLKNRIVFNEVKLRTLISDTVKRCKVLARKKNISITAGPIPQISLSGDKMYLEKMLVNLVKNSVIYGNQNGHTKITIQKSKVYIIINITDNGIGISKEDLPHVFERFYRADKSHNSSDNNTGLGLAIVKWVAETHGGTVSVKSIEHKGSIFTVSIPIKKI